MWSLNSDDREGKQVTGPNSQDEGQLGKGERFGTQAKGHTKRAPTVLLWGQRNDQISKPEKMYIKG